MAKKKAKAKKTPAKQAKRAGKGGVVPPVEHQFKPGQSGNPAGRKPMGLSVREWQNAMQDWLEKDLRAVARDKNVPHSKRVAAIRQLCQIELPDLADYEPLLSGKKTVTALRKAGVNTAAIKKFKMGENGPEIELFNRSGDEYDRMMDRTLGRPTQAVEVSGPDKGPVVTKQEKPIDHAAYADFVSKLLGGVAQSPTDGAPPAGEDGSTE